MTAGHLAAALLACACACAAEAGPAGSEVLARYRAIEAPAARLACYDAAAGRPSPAGGAAMTSVGDAAPVAVPDADADRATETRNFGLTPAQISPAKAQGPQAVTGRITGIGGTAGHVSVTLDNGQVWSVADDASRLSVGDPVTIRHAALGSFLMTTPDRHAYTVHRVR